MEKDLKLGKLLGNNDAQVAAECVFYVRVLVDEGMFGEHFDVEVLNRCYEFLSGRSLDYVLECYKCIKHGNKNL